MGQRIETDENGNFTDTCIIYELYIKNPVTKENGWDIKWVRSTEEQVKSYPDFDCIISRNVDNIDAYVKIKVEDWFPNQKEVA
jgi:hypothetical protein